MKSGAVLHSSIAECVKGRDAVITIVGFPKDVEEGYRSDEGIFAGAFKGSYLIDMTTSSPKLAKSLAEEGETLSFHVMDSHGTGGENDVIDGTLSILTSPPSFFLKLIVKDLKIAESGTIERRLHLEVLQQVLSDYEQLESEGCDDEGTQALFRHYE